MLTVADTFVDQVLHAACKVAKERGSKALEIRDIQLTLERGYNIRIPGYASDEIRTVKKIQPATNWINKMSAVQASKVTGGRRMWTVRGCEEEIWAMRNENAEGLVIAVRVRVK